MRYKSLKFKLSILCLALVIVPTITIGGFSFRQLTLFGHKTVEETYSALKDQTLAVLQAGIKTDRQMIINHVEKVERDVKRLSESSSFHGYLSARKGKNEVLNRVPEKEAASVSNSLLQLCIAQRRVLYQKLSTDIAVLEKILSSNGGAELAGLTTEWNIINQFTKETKKLVLPVFQVGFDVMTHITDFEEIVPVVDEAQELIQGSCSIFQRINDEGDMLLVATTQKMNGNSRATSYYMPSVSENGEPNPVISAILRNNTYKGRAYIVNDWFISAFKPIKDEDDRIIGMLNVGARETDNEALIDIMNNTTIGKTGYPVILDPKGNIVFHPREEMAGKNIFSDLSLTKMKDYFKDIKDKPSGMVNYSYEGKSKFSYYRYFKAWDWIICATGYWGEFGQEQTAKQLFMEEIQSLSENATIAVNGKQVPAYQNIRYINEEGYEICRFEKNQFVDSTANVKQEKWFLEALENSPGTIINDGVILDNNQIVLRVVCPVAFQNSNMGVIAVDFQWPLLCELIKERSYGKDSYSLMIDPDGHYVAHPAHSFKDQVNILKTSSKDLKKTVNNELLKGKEGYAICTQNRIKYFLVYTPIDIGHLVYSFSIVIAEKAFLSLPNSIKANTEKSFSQVVTILGIAGTIMIVCGTLIGLFFSMSLSRNIRHVNYQLTDGATLVSTAVNQISSASTEMAEGVTEQAASLQETAASLEKISKMSLDNARNAQEARQLNTEISTVVDKADAGMEDLTSSMSSIFKASQETQKIVKTIDQIAFQTQLLSLNASVEAARAGESGSGFAIVAEEVRQLAINTTKAAKETEQLVMGSYEKIQHGSNLVSQNNLILKEIQGGAKQASVLISQICEESHEQQQGIEQITSAMNKMDIVTQKNASFASEFATASEDVNSQTLQMQWIVETLARIVDGNKIHTDSDDITHIVDEKTNIDNIKLYS
ncbi:methyl-accepting chemotaxis protein [Candidatus Magnetomoraceae bacterium gMMP-15]